MGAWQRALISLHRAISSAAHPRHKQELQTEAAPGTEMTTLCKSYVAADSYSMFRYVSEPDGVGQQFIVIGTCATPGTNVNHRLRRLPRSPVA